jgi:hypothetical protein
VLVPCGRVTLTTTLILGNEPTAEENMMMNWTDEVVRAEADYRRQQLHKLASGRRSTSERRSGAWNRWWHLGRRR